MKTTLVASILFGVLSMTGLAGAQPRSDSDRIWIAPAVKKVSSDAGIQKFTLAVMVDNSTGAACFALPFTFAGHPGLRIDTSVVTLPDMKGVTYGPGGGSNLWTTRTSLVDNTHQTIKLGFIRWDRPGAFIRHDTLCYIHFVLEADGVSAQVPLDTIPLPNVLFLTLVDIYAHDYIPLWSPALIDISPLSEGDLNGDGSVNASDIILLARFVMEKGPAPASLVLADANCDGSVSLVDILWLVNFVFKSGPAPIASCDVWSQG